MKNFCILSDALYTIEENLSRDISPQQVADACHCSLSSLQKLFRYAFHISVKDYISRWRLTCCAKALLETEKSVMEIGLDWGFHSPEVFTRAFSRLWGKTSPGFIFQKFMIFLLRICVGIFCKVPYLVV